MLFSIETWKKKLVCLCFQKEFFQDDLYPDTAVWWESVLTASAWLSGSNGQHKKISLKPKDMTPGRDTDSTNEKNPSFRSRGLLCSRHVGACHVTVCLCASCCVLFSVSEAPKEAPVRKYLPSSVYLEEKTDEQKKEEVRGL